MTKQKDTLSVDMYFWEDTEFDDYHEDKILIHAYMYLSNRITADLSVLIEWCGTKDSIGKRSHDVDSTIENHSQVIVGHYHQQKPNITTQGDFTLQEADLGALKVSLEQWLSVLYLYSDSTISSIAYYTSDAINWELNKYFDRQEMEKAIIHVPVRSAEWGTW